MKIILTVLAAVFFTGMINAQNNCFDSCYTDIKRSTLPFKERNVHIIESLVGCPFPDFEAESANGRVASLKKLSGKVVVLNFYFAGCIPCVEEIPALNKLATTYKEKNVEFIAFSRDAPAAVSSFIETTGFIYQVIPKIPSLESRFCILAGWPMHMVLDQNGIVRDVSCGGITGDLAKEAAYNRMKPVIDSLLIKKSNFQWKKK